MTRSRSEAVTHHIDWDVPGAPRTITQAICGTVLRRGDSVGQPTCPTCRAILAARERDDNQHTTLLREGA